MKDLQTTGTERRSGCDLDLAVLTAAASIESAGFPRPQALLLLGTGGGLLPLRLANSAKTSLSGFVGVPEAWRSATLRAGELEGLRVWILEDAAGSPERGGLPLENEPAWVRGFPVWLAAAAGAAVLVHTSAGTSLAPEIAAGSLAIVADHLNLSGRNPLTGLAASGLGPLFPDLSRLHHARLRESALALCASLGIDAREVVAACTPSPALETPAERRFYARAGAQVAVQGLENPLLAAAHAGLQVLAFVCATDQGEVGADIAEILAAAEKLAPALEDLLVRLAPGIARVAAESGGGLEEGT